MQQTWQILWGSTDCRVCSFLTGTRYPRGRGVNEQGTLEVGESRWYNKIAVYYEQ